MTGLILVVDDVPANVKLLEAKLNNEYYDVITANDGYKCIELAKEHMPDLILLDVMMPGMDGFTTCQELKKDKDVSHIPVVMVTALSDPSDRVQGLESGADDFITKPINDTALFARVRSLIRIKVLIDELRLRDQSGAQMGAMADDEEGGFNVDVSGATVLVIDDDAVSSKRMQERLSENYKVSMCADAQTALDKVRSEDIDLIVVSTTMLDVDGLRLSTQIKAIEDARNVPIIMMVDEDDERLMLKGLELGINDYLTLPVDYNEMAARVKTQIRRKKFQDALRANYEESVSMAITDGLTKLYNRHYFDTHVVNVVRKSQQNHKPLSLAIMDMDHFKSVNDDYGHDVGDEVLRQLAGLIVQATRSADLTARFGGEEFVVLMPETDLHNAIEVSDRIRKTIEDHEFKVPHEIGVLKKTISIGVANLEEYDTPESLLKKADTNLYEAKHGGRNRVVPDLEHAGEYKVKAQKEREEFIANIANKNRETEADRAPAPQAPQRIELGGGEEAATTGGPTIPTLDEFYKEKPAATVATQLSTSPTGPQPAEQKSGKLVEGKLNYIDPSKLDRPPIELELDLPSTKDEKKESF